MTDTLTFSWPFFATKCDLQVFPLKPPLTLQFNIIIGTWKKMSPVPASDHSAAFSLLSQSVSQLLVHRTRYVNVGKNTMISIISKTTELILDSFLLIRIGNLQFSLVCGCIPDGLKSSPAGQKRCSGPSYIARFLATGMLSSFRVRWAGWSPSWLVPLSATDDSRSKLILPSGLGYSIGVQSLAGFSWCASRPGRENGARLVTKCSLSPSRDKATCGCADSEATRNEPHCWAENKFFIHSEQSGQKKSSL